MARALTFGPVDAVTRRKGTLVAPAAWLKPDAVIKAKKRKRHVDVILPDTQMLKRDVKLPKTPRRMLERAVTLDMLRRTPFKADQTYFMLANVQTDATRTALTQWIARRDDIDGLRDRLAQAGLLVRRVRVAGAPALPLADFSGSVYPMGRVWRGVNALAVLAVLAQVYGFGPNLPSRRKPRASTKKPSFSASQPKRLRCARRLRRRVISL